MPNASVPSSSPSGRSWGELVMGGPPTLSPERCDWGTGTIIGLRAVRGKNRKRPRENTSNLADPHSREDHAPRFAGKRRKIAGGLRWMGRFQRRSARRLRASSQGVEERILPPPAGGAVTPSENCLSVAGLPLPGPEVRVAELVQ